MDPLRPEAVAGPGDGIRARLRLALAEALRARDTIAVSALRSALGAIGNAEAVDPGAAAPAGSAGPHIAGAVSGLGAAEAARRSLNPAQIERIVRAEAAEREDAACGYERAGHTDRAARLRREARLLLTVLADDDRTGTVADQDRTGTVADRDRTGTVADRDRTGR